MGTCCITGAQLGALWWPRRVGLGWGGREAYKGDTCIHIADSLCCRAETNTTLQSNYITIKKNTAKIKLIFLGFETGHLVYLVTYTWVFHTRFFLCLFMGWNHSNPVTELASYWMQLPDRDFCLLFQKVSGFIVVSWNSRGHLALSSCHLNTQLGQVRFSRMEI